MADGVAVVTGAARGIGAAVARRLAADGMRVVLADRDAAGEAVAAGIPGARFVQADVGDEAAVAKLIGGLDRLDALVCNAGFMIRKKLAALSLAEWQSVLATNLTSSFLLVRAGEAMLRAARGSVVTIASTRAHMSEPDTESYSASKGGLLALTPFPGGEPGAGCAGQLHQPGLDRHQGQRAVRGGPRATSGRARRHAGGCGGAGGIPGRAGKQLYDRKRVPRGWGHDPQDDLRLGSSDTQGASGNAGGDT